MEYIIFANFIKAHVAFLIKSVYNAETINLRIYNNKKWLSLFVGNHFKFYILINIILVVRPAAVPIKKIKSPFLNFLFSKA